MNLKPLNIDQVNKKILEKKIISRPDYDLINPTGNYQDEDAKIYQEKYNEFSEISKKYQEFNEQTFLTSKVKLLKDYENFIERISGDFFHFKRKGTENEAIEEIQEKIDNYDMNGRKQRKRLVRNIHEKLNTNTEDYCIEPWFYRYLILNKFIHFARAIVLKNRLLKNLEKLKQLDREKILEFEKKPLKYHNDTYSQLFEKFL